MRPDASGENQASLKGVSQSEQWFCLNSDPESFQRPKELTDLNKFEETVFQRYTKDSLRKKSQDITLQDLNMRLIEMSHKVDHLVADQQVNR